MHMPSTHSSGSFLVNANGVLVQTHLEESTQSRQSKDLATQIKG